LSGFIILRNTPGPNVQLDLVHLRVSGGFGGFQQVPAGLHYISVIEDRPDANFWYYLQPDEVVVRVFNRLIEGFEEDTQNSEQHNRELELSGDMADALMTYPQEHWQKWQELTSHINSLDQASQEYLANLHSSLLKDQPLAPSLLETGKSRFEFNLSERYDTAPDAFLAEFQYAFVVWLLTKAPDLEERALERWRALLLSVYDAGEDTMLQYRDLFAKIVDALLAQFQFLPEEFFEPDSFVIEHLEYMVEDMIDTEDAGLAEKAGALKSYIA